MKKNINYSFHFQDMDKDVTPFKVYLDLSKAFDTLITQYS